MWTALLLLLIYLCMQLNGIVLNVIYPGDVSRCLEPGKYEYRRIRRKRSLLKIMVNQSHMIENIDSYRPERILRSTNMVKLKTTFTRSLRTKKALSIEG